MQLEYGVEYFPNYGESEQWQELAEYEFLELIAQHNKRGIDARLEYESFTTFDNGRDGKRLTLVDEWGLYYG